MPVKLASKNVFSQFKIQVHCYKDIGNHSNLPTSAIIVLGLLEKKNKESKMNNFVWVVKILLISGAS